MNKLQKYKEKYNKEYNYFDLIEAKYFDYGYK
jgi:hypothetical protein